MKQILFLFLSFSIVNKTFAQDRIYEPFRLAMSIGLVVPKGNTYLDARFSFSLEPKYNISDQLALGLQFEIDPYGNFAGTSEPFKINAVSSYLLTGDYYFTKSPVIRPFLGIGAGIFTQTFSSTGYPFTKTKGEKPGLETRAGLEIKHLRIALEYNATTFEKEKKMNYLNLKFGAFLWGRDKNK